MYCEQHFKVWTLEHVAFIVTAALLKAKNEQFLNSEFHLNGNVVKKNREGI
jgi:hypothetical protein